MLDDMARRIERGAVRYAPLLVLAGSPACSKECPEYARAPSVFVIDAKTDLPVCRATVVATEGDHVEVGRSVVENCTGFYWFSYRVGAYSVSVNAAGFAPTEREMRVTTGSCEQYWTEPDGPFEGHPGYESVVTIPLAREP